MKKTITTIILMCFLLAGLFAGEFNNYIGVAYNYGIFTERGTLAYLGEETTNGTSKTKCNGIALSVASYLENNVGFYLNTGYYFPNTMESVIDGETTKIKSDQWDHSMILSAILAPSYKIAVNDNFNIYGALGLHISQYSFNASIVSMINYTLGIGGDIGIRYMPAKNFFITAGSLFSHDFHCWYDVSILGVSAKDDESYNFGGFRPYIGMGFTYNSSFK